MQCLGNKVLVLDSALENKSYDFLFMTEHWQREVQLKEIHLQNFTLRSYFCRNDLIHGGVAIFKNDKCNTNDVNLDLLEYCIEGVFEVAGVKLDSIRYVLIVVYRTPNVNFSLFISAFQELLLHISSYNYKIVIGGDFNLDFLGPSGNLSIFRDLLDCFNLKITIGIPTRVTATSSTCIDNFLIDNVLECRSNVVNYGLSDHYFQVLEIKTKCQLSGEPKPRSTWKRFFNDHNMARFKQFLCSEDWLDVLRLNCPNLAFNAFANILLYYFEISFPLRRVNSNTRNTKKYKLSPELQSLKEKVILYGELSKFDRRYRNISAGYNRKYREALRVARVGYHDSIVSNTQNKSKAMWSVINSIKKTNKVRKDIAISENDVLLSDEVVANNFTERFTLNCGNNDIDYEFLSQNVPFNDVSIFFSPVTVYDTERMFNCLKNSNSAGVDGVTNVLLKKCKFELAGVITVLINQMFSSGCFPDKLKLGRIIPVYKRGDSNNYSNYRPISLLSSISKLFELAINEQLTSFFNRHRLLSPCQHGFTRNLSTETALCSFVKSIVDTLDRGMLASGLFIDFSQAFDRVDHVLLLEKMHRYGIRGVPFNLVKSYLDNRYQFVQINRFNGTTKRISQGVPQGSILGPFLYLIYANDLIHYIETESVRVVCYADDTNILVTASDHLGLKSVCERIYTSTLLWAEKNFLQLNREKTVLLCFTLSRHVTEDNFKLFEGSLDELECRESTKMLGVAIDCKLQWGSQVDNLCSNLRSACYGLRFLSGQCGLATLMSLYYANFHSRLKYGIMCWGNSSQIHRVFILQKFAVRIICRLQRRETCRVAFRQNRILTVFDMYILEVCTYVYRYRHLFESCHFSHNYNTRFYSRLLPPPHRTATYQKSFFFNCCRFYNALEIDIKVAPNIIIFKNRLKNLLYQKNCYSLNDFFL